MKPSAWLRDAANIIREHEGDSLSPATTASNLDRMAAAIESSPEDYIDRIADIIWPLDNLASDDGRDELRRDVMKVVQAVMPGMPLGLGFVQEWRFVLYRPDGERHTTESNWYDNLSIVTSMLNPEWPEPSSTGWHWVVQTRWVSEIRTDNKETA